jgi:transcriptional regulator with XRE-family HTH domain
MNFFPKVEKTRDVCYNEVNKTYLRDDAMDLGSKIKQARIAAGLSQKQLCGQQITRNMLSQIENGSARPSMKTLGYLAEQLGKPMSYFLEEESVVFPNQQPINEAKTALALGNLEQMRHALDAFQEPDSQFFEERQLLEYYWHIKRAEQALHENMTPYGVKLLYRALALDGLYITAQMRCRCRVLLALAGENVAVECDLDALLARAGQCTDPKRRLEILAAADETNNETWNRLRADALFELGQYEEAAAAYGMTRQDVHVYGKLEVCYRELGDYKKAYEYACKQRQEA